MSPTKTRIHMLPALTVLALVAASGLATDDASAAPTAKKTGPIGPVVNKSPSSKTSKLQHDPLNKKVMTKRTGLQQAARQDRQFGPRNARAGSKMAQNVGSKGKNKSKAGVGTVQQPLSVKAATIWDSPKIPVCWENPQGKGTEIGWVRSALAQTWEAESKVEFTGWGICPSSFPGIRIRVEDDGPHTKGLGKELANKKNGMVLNFTFKNWSPDCADNREFCIRTIAVHEFGHALGAGHEQNRDDVPDEACRDMEQGSDPDWNLTPYDLSSVMNYCNPEWSGSGRLSPKDIEGIRSVYGWQRSASFKTGGVGDSGEGAGVAIANVGGNGRLDLIVAAYDAPNGANTFRYRVGFDMDTRGKPRKWSGVLNGPSMGHEGDGAGVAVGDINGNGKPDLVLLAYDAPSGNNNFRYRVGFDLDGAGRPTKWGDTVNAAGFGHKGEGAGIAIADVDGDGRDDVVIMAYDAPSKSNNFRYRVGFDLQPGRGNPKRWSSVHQVGGVGNSGEGAGVEVGDFDADGSVELMLMAYDAPDGANGFRYKHVRLNPDGRPGTEIRTRMLPGLGHVGEGAGLATADLDQDGWLDLVLLAYDAPNGANTFRWKTFFDVTEP